MPKLFDFQQENQLEISPTATATLLSFYASLNDQANAIKKTITTVQRQKVEHQIAASLQPVSSVAFKRGLRKYLWFLSFKQRSRKNVLEGFLNFPSIFYWQSIFLKSQTFRKRYKNYCGLKQKQKTRLERHLILLCVFKLSTITKLFIFSSMLRFFASYFHYSFSKCISCIFL